MEINIIVHRPNPVLVRVVSNHRGTDTGAAKFFPVQITDKLAVKTIGGIPTLLCKRNMVTFPGINWYTDIQRTIAPRIGGTAIDP